MRIYNKIVFDIATMGVIEADSLDYTGPIALCKGDNTASEEEQSQENFSQQLQNAFNTNNAAQQNQLNFLNNKMQASINNPQGYSAQTLASMRAQANDQVSAQDQNVQRAVNTSEATKGGADALPSGVSSQIGAAIASQAAQAGNNAQQNITENNANLENSNYWNAVKGEEGVASAENPEGMAGEDNGAASTVGSLSNAVTQSDGPTFGSILGGVIGAGLGAAGSIFKPTPPTTATGPDWGGG
jgi:hypothetical protein